MPVQETYEKSLVTYFILLLLTMNSNRGLKTLSLKKTPSYSRLCRKACIMVSFVYDRL